MSAERVAGSGLGLRRALAAVSVVAGVSLLLVSAPALAIVPETPAPGRAGVVTARTAVLEGGVLNAFSALGAPLTAENAQSRLVGEPVAGEVAPFTTLTPPQTPSMTSPVAALTATSATFEGVLNPGGAGEAGSYEFLYRASASECQGGEPAEDLTSGQTGDAGGESEPVSAQVGSLQPNTAYTVCLLARNGAEPAETAVSLPVHFTTLSAAPVVESVSTPTVASDHATLQAQVDPENEPTSACVFDYGRTTAYTGQEPCEPASVSGSSQSVTASLTGLTRDTDYDYRVQIRTAAGESELAGRFATNPSVAGPPQANCPNPGHTGPSASLPDCRAYEQVTPVDKLDSEDMFGDNDEARVAGSDTAEVGYSNQEGNKFFLTTAAAFGEDPAAGENDYVFSRTPQGWSTTSLASPPLGTQSDVGEAFFNPSFSLVAFNAELGSSGNEAARSEVSLFGPPGGLPPSGSYTQLIKSPREIGGDKVVGASENLSRVFFSSKEHSLAAAAEEQLPESYALYEYSEGHYSLVNVENDGKTTSPCGAISPGQKKEFGVYAHAVSNDGSRVLFISPDPNNYSCYTEHRKHFEGSPPQLYLRAGGRTVEVSAPEGGSEPPTGEGPQPVAFAGASADGSRVFFITRAELTANDEGNHEPELYEYNVPAAKLTRVSSGDSHDAVGNVGWDVPSEDGSTVYFTATGQLAPGAPHLNAEEAHAVEAPEQPFNLYHYDTETGVTTYIATVSGHDLFTSEAGGVITLNIRQPFNQRSGWETTADGQFLLFEAMENVTGYDTHASCQHNIGGLEPHLGCTEVYRYDAADGSLICVSCDPSGAPPSSSGMFDNNTVFREVRAISEDGAYVFFDSSDPLVPAATNGQVDVYEWHEGEISLIGSGQDPSASFFLGTDPSGDDVFFGTHAQLVPQDTDSSGDLYDARVDGGFPPSQGSAACEGDACQAPPAAPAEQTPGSLTFSGAGNLPAQAPAPPPAAKPVANKPAKCRKGLVRKKNRCVKSKSRAAKHRAVKSERRAGR